MYGLGWTKGNILLFIIGYQFYVEPQNIDEVIDGQENYSKETVHVGKQMVKIYSD